MSLVHVGIGIKSNNNRDELQYHIKKRIKILIKVEFDFHTNKFCYSYYVKTIIQTH